MSIGPAAPQQLEDYLEAVVTRLRELLGERLVGVYTTGSLALGGYTHGRSDVDLMAVVEDAVPRPALEAVALRLAHASLPCPATGLELVVYPRRTVRDAKAEAGYLLDLNTGSEIPPKASFDPRESPAFWYVIDRAVTYQSGRALVGSPPRDLFRPLPYELLLPVVIESLEAHARREAGELLDSAVLNACRALRFAVEGRWYAKSVAAEWAMSATPDSRVLIESALATYPEGREAGRHLPADEVYAFLGHVLTRLRQLRAPSAEGGFRGGRP